MTEWNEHLGVPPGESAAARFRDVVLLVASDVVQAVRAARMCSRLHRVGRPVVLAVPHPGRVGEPLALYPDERRLPPELMSIAGRARLTLRRAGLDHVVLSVPFVDSDNGATRSRRIVTALVDASRRLRASSLVIDELAYWEPATERVAAGLGRAAEVGRLGRTELVVTGVPAIHGSPAAPASVHVPSKATPTIPASRTDSDRLTAPC